MLGEILIGAMIVALFVGAHRYILVILGGLLGLVFISIWGALLIAFAIWGILDEPKEKKNEAVPRSDAEDSNKWNLKE